MLALVVSDIECNKRDPLVLETNVAEHYKEKCRKGGKSGFALNIIFFYLDSGETSRDQEIVSVPTK